MLSTLIQSWEEKKLSSSTKIKEWVELSPTSHPFPSQETTPPTEILVLKLSFFSSLNSVYFTDRFELYLVTALSSKRFSKFLFKKAEYSSGREKEFDFYWGRGKTVNNPEEKKRKGNTTMAMR